MFVHPAPIVPSTPNSPLLAITCTYHLPNTFTDGDLTLTHSGRASICPIVTSV